MLGTFNSLFHFRCNRWGVVQAELGVSSDLAVLVTSFGSVAGRDELLAKHVAELP